MQLLVQVADLTDSDPMIDQLLPKAGDVRMFVDGANRVAPQLHDDPTLRIVTADLTLMQVDRWLQPLMTPAHEHARFRDRSLDLSRLSDGMTYDQLKGITTLKDQPAPLVS